MVTALQANQIDVGIGLTEGWVAGLGKAQAEGRNAGYSLVGTFVETPLCWAISTGAGRDDITGIEGLMGKKMGVSRIGRYVISSVPSYCVVFYLLQVSMSKFQLNTVAHM